VSLHPMPLTEQAKTFNRLHEAIRKDVDRLFGFLTKRFHIALHPGRYRSVKQLIIMYKAVSILQDMCLESRPDVFLSGRKGAGGTNGGVGAGSDDEGPTGAAAAATGDHDGNEGGACGGNPLSGVTRPPGMSRGRVLTRLVTPP